MTHPLQTDSLKLYESLMTLQRLDSVLSLTTVIVLFYIASHHECSASDVAKAIGLSQPATARHLQRLGQGSEGSKAVGQGLGLIEYVPDHLDQRRRLYELTREGHTYLAAAIKPIQLTQGQLIEAVSSVLNTNRT